MKAISHCLLLLVLIVAAGCRHLDCQHTEERLALGNGFVHLELDKKTGILDVLKGDFHGQGNYGENLVVGIEPGKGEAKGVSCRLLRHNASGTTVQVEGATTWTLALDANSRKVRIEVPVTGQLGIHCRQWFMVGFYRRGVAQCVRNDGKRFASTDPLEVFYTMDKQAGSVAVVPVVVPVGTESVVAGDGLELRWPEAASPAAMAQYDLFPNQYAFPAHRAESQRIGDFDDQRALCTAVYGSAAGCLGSFVRPGSAYPNPAIPARGYGDNYTFFDPDSWSTVTTLSFSGDPYLEGQARQILELAESRMKADGQIPHHFDGDNPTYVAISTATQTGPNIFWMLAAMEYVTGTGDTDWLRAHYPNLKKSADWLLGFYDPERQLLKVNGSLWVDTFRRQGYTFDTNVFMLRLLPLLASAANHCGDPAVAARYMEHEQHIKAGLESLWNLDDHYQTARSADWTTVMDKVDSENYAAIAWRATTDPARIRAIYQRLDRWAHPGGRGTWVAEGYYGPAECFLGNTGDSACAMARHWWVDMVARHVSGDSETFLKLYRNVRTDLLANTWLTERYNGQGVSYRCLGYHEYPEVLTMLMREQLYGIDVKLDTVTVNPIAKAPWNYDNGRLAVAYGNDRISLRIPGQGQRRYRVCGLPPSASFRLSTGQAVETDANGVATFIAPVGDLVVLARETP